MNHLSLAAQSGRLKIPEDLIKSVHTPIGLDIQAETPEEIAVSIVAELIQVRNKASISRPLPRALGDH